MTRAVAFDMDGVLVDSEPLHVKIANRVLEPVGLRYTEAVNREFLGRTVSEMLDCLIRRHRLPGNVATYEAAYDRLLLRALRRRRPARQGAVWLIRELRHRGCQIGLASSSKRTWIEATLHALRLTKMFDVIASGDMVEHGKPAPDIYLLAARQLGTPPSACVAVEDSPAGLQAARAAGMMAVGLVTPQVNLAELQEADRVISSLRDFPFDLVGSGDPASEADAWHGAAKRSGRE